MHESRLEGKHLAIRWGGAEIAYHAVASIPGAFIALAMIDKSSSQDARAIFALVGAAIGTYLQSRILSNLFTNFSTRRYFAIVFSASVFYELVSYGHEIVTYQSNFGLYLLINFLFVFSILADPIAQWMGIRSYLSKAVSWIWVTLAIDIFAGAIMLVGLLPAGSDPVRFYGVVVVFGLLLSFPAGFAKGMWLDRLVKVNDECAEKFTTDG